MPQIPLVISQETRGDASGLDRSYSRVTASPDDFGAQVGKAMQTFGGQIGDTALTGARIYEHEQTRQRAENVANGVAQTNLTEPAMEARLNAPPDGSGVVKATQDAQRALIEKNAEELFPNDPMAARAYKTHMLQQMNHFTAQSTMFEYTQKAAYSKTQADKSLSVIGNKLRADPTMYDQAVQDGNNVIDLSTAIPNHLKDQYKQEWARNAANTRFEGMIASAKTADDLKVIEAELLASGTQTLTEKDFEALSKATGKTRAELSGLTTGQTLTAMANEVRNDPAKHDAIVAQGLTMIDASSILPVDKEKAKVAWTQAVANTQAEGKIHKATTTEALQKIEDELSKDNVWRSKLSEKDYENLLRHIDSGKKVLQTKADTDARVAVEALEARNNDPNNVLIPTAELQATQALVAESKNTLTATRLMRIVRDQQLKTETRGLPPAELQGRANQSRGGAGSMYPNLPREVSQHISEATSIFPNVSAAYLGGTAVREYGANFPERRSRGNVQFAPQSAREDVNLSNVRPIVKDALTIAGQVYGEPLVITSGYRTQQHQDSIREAGDPNRPDVARHSNHTEGTAVDISTVGKTPEQKAQMVDALVQAGFTGFGEYGTHIHADMRTNVPTTYGSDNKTPWGGWTPLSPQVQATLDRRGYKAGASADSIDRSGPGAGIIAATAPPAVDYTKGTDGTTAKGLFQFVDKTWKEYSDPAQHADVVNAVKQITGVDFASMSPEQRLAYRGDARVSTIMAAALASKNKVALEATLQRPVSDAELYMAHFMGVGGATAFLRAAVTNPDTAGAAVLPDAAATNKNVFYNKDGTPRSVSQIYNNITGTFLVSPSAVAYGDSVTYQRLHDNAAQQVKTNPIGYARTQGTQTILPLSDPGGWEARGSTFNNIGKYFQVGREDNKPFDTATELPDLLKQFKDGSSEQVVALLQNMARMDINGQGAFTAGMKQLGMKDTSYDVAGQLASTDAPTATAIVAGEKRMEKDVGSKTYLGEEHDARNAFTKTVGTALNSVSPEARDAIRKAANAHYVETAMSSHAEKFNEAEYAKSVQAVMGGRDGARVGTVNSAATVLPKGVDADTMEKAVDNLKDGDLIRLSVTRDGKPAGSPPMYTNGQPVPALDVSSQGKFRYVGADTYQVQMGDGKYLVVAQREQNGFTPYLLRMDKDAVTKLAAQPRKQFEPPATMIGVQ